jgi:uncharacterized protein YjiK
MRFPYDLNRPDATYKLGKKYREISGIWPLPGSETLAFVQDELIRVYQFDLATEEISRSEASLEGDSEDVVILGRTAYILVAGGQPAIQKFTDYTDQKAPIARYDLGLDKAHEPEGLCLDAKGDRLLIACKGSPVRSDRKRQVHSFDLRTHKPNTTSPVLTIDSDTLGIGDDTFHPSGIAIHPNAEEIYVVGTRGVKMLVRMRWNGTVDGATELDKKRFEQPEGIAFSRSGDLFICSEGKKRKARIYRFSPKERNPASAAPDRSNID